MNRDRIREIVRIAQAWPVRELRVREGDLEVRVVKAGAAEAPPEAEPGTQPPAAQAQAGDTVIVRATKVGFFHRGSGPGAAPVVSEGESVEAGQTIAYLEALRTLMEVTADVSGTIARVIAEDGVAVEYGQPLFEIRRVEGAETSEDV